MLLVGLLVALVAPQTGALQAQNLNNFTLSLFAADYFLDKNEQGIGVMTVNELIVAEFPDFDQNHGIERSIPQTYGDFDLNLKVESVTDANDTPYQYTTYEKNDHLVLRIGDPDKHARGTTLYKINYSVENVITFYGDRDEFFWDVNGTDWRVPISQTLAQVHVAPGLMANRQPHQVCYTGVFGASSTEQDCTIDTRDNTDSETLIFSAGSFNAGENLSVLLGFEPGTFYKNPWPGIWRLIGYGLGIGLPLTAIGIMWRRWYKYGRDPRGKGTIIAEYVPPKDLNAITSDVLLNERFRTSSLSSALIELATLGYIKIYETKKPNSKDKSEYELELIKGVDELKLEQTALIRALFGQTTPSDERIKLTDKSHKLATQAQALSSSVPARLSKAGYFRSNPNSVRVKYWIVAFVVGAAVFALGAIMSAWPVMVAAPVSLLAIGLFGLAMPARTEKGVAARDHLLGVKEYIKLAESDRIKFLQSPDGVRQYGQPTAKGTQIKLFETLLPYAMLFGLEKDWAKQFEHLYTKPPEWLNSYHSFNAASFASLVNGLSTSTVSAFTPASSSGSSFSGGGGGGSGGGGGGGGGGGW